jgi:hypothetical protein
MPLDVLKVRMQLQGEQGKRQYRSLRSAAVEIARSEGVAAFFKGLRPALLRQATYGTLRIGFYAPAKRAMGAPSDEEILLSDARLGGDGLRRKLAAGMLSGSLAAFVCNPTDLIKVRMQADGMRARGPSAAVSPSYRGVWHAAAEIVRREGWLGLYTGVGPTTYRAAVVAAAELVSYDEVKLHFMMRAIPPSSEALGGSTGSLGTNGAHVRASGRTADARATGTMENTAWRTAFFRAYGLLGFHNDGVALHAVSGLVSGLMATVASSPFDVIKSRVMSQPLCPNTGRGLWYSGMVDCWVKCVRREGAFFMWRGFFPNYLNKGPTVVLFFLLYEQVRLFGDQF